MKYPETLPFGAGYGNGITGPGAAGVIHLEGKCTKTLVTADYPGIFSTDKKLLSQVVCVCLGDKQEEHAAYIVTACNLLPELVEMLEFIDDQLDYCLPHKIAEKVSKLIKRAK